MWNESDEDLSGHDVLIWTASVFIQKVVPIEFDIGTFLVDLCLIKITHNYCVIAVNNAKNYAYAYKYYSLR